MTLSPQSTLPPIHTLIWIRSPSPHRPQSLHFPQSHLHSVFPTRFAGRAGFSSVSVPCTVTETQQIAIPMIRKQRGAISHHHGSQQPKQLSNWFTATALPPTSHDLLYLHFLCSCIVQYGSHQPPVATGHLCGQSDLRRAVSISGLQIFKNVKFRISILPKLTSLLLFTLFNVPRRQFRITYGPHILDRAGLDTPNELLVAERICVPLPLVISALLSTIQLKLKLQRWTSQSQKLIKKTLTGGLPDIPLFPLTLMPWLDPEWLYPSLNYFSFPQQFLFPSLSGPPEVPKLDQKKIL